MSLRNASDTLSAAPDTLSVAVKLLGAPRSRISQGCIVIAAAAVSLVSAHQSFGQVVVEQVESSLATPTATYAPFNFSSATATGAAVGYPNISNFYAQYTTGTTYSAHAQVVANNFYGAGTVGGNAISTVYVDCGSVLVNGSQTSPFVTNVLNCNFLSRTTTPMPSTSLAQAGVRVSNHSYEIWPQATALGNFQEIAAADYMIDRDNIVWVGAAVNGTNFSPTGVTYLTWMMPNSIAVRGDAGQTPFNPYSDPTYAGRQHADLWVGDLASFACGTVSGAAAALIQQGINMGSTAAQDQRVIKSVMMSGSNLTAQPSTFTNAYTSGVGLTMNNLDPNGGAGQFSYSTSLSILSAGQRKYVSASGTTPGSTIAAGNVPSTNPQGWSLGTIAAKGSYVVLVNVTGPVTSLNATLNWDVTSTVLNGALNVTSNAAQTNANLSNPNLIFADLSLELRPVTWNGTSYVLGSAMTNGAGQAFYSNATGTTNITTGTVTATYTLNDNVEHLFEINGQFAPGTYALIVTGDSSTNAFSAVAALSYNMTQGAAPQWNVDANATYGSTGNWTGSAAPSGVSTVATFGNTITAARTITVASPITLGTLTFSGSNTYTLAGTGGATLTLSNGALGPASVQVTAGNPVINMPVIAFDSTTVSTAAGTSITLQSLTNNATFSTTGLGTVRVASTISGPGSLSVGQGSTLVVSAAASSASHVNVVNQTGLTVAGNFAISSSPSSALLQSRVTVLNSLSVTPTGFLDLGNSDLIVHSSSVAAVQAYISSWFAGGLRTGTTGIGSSLSGTGTGMDKYAGLAVIANSNGAGGALYASFDGIAVSATDVLVKYTYLGDTNLDGVVDANDLANVLAGQAGGLTGWVNGDTNYDGVVNAADLANVLNSLSHQYGSFGNSFGGGTGGAVPEPTAALLSGAPLALLARRRR
jgi:hypothetical protein